jgi:thymidylate synthase (FAD)
MIQGQEFPVLDHGFIKYIGHYGDDTTIESSARQSYGTGTRKISSTRGLLRTLMREHHDSPFESVDITLQFRTPIFVARQFFRHRLFSPNEVSARYSILTDDVETDFYIPTLDQICVQDTKNRQGRAEPLEFNAAHSVQQEIREVTQTAFDSYERLIAAGVARETARMVLPLNVYTTFTFKGNLRTWLHFLHLRMDKHTQWESRQYANVVAEIVQYVAPEAYAAWQEYVQWGESYSWTENDIIRDFIHNHGETEIRDYVKQYDVQLTPKELDRFIEKIGVHDPFESEL